jgi:hypothetical protein
VISNPDGAFTLSRTALKSEQGFEADNPHHGTDGTYLKAGALARAGQIDSTKTKTLLNTISEIF